MMGVGKPTVGRLLADRLGAVYIDNDELVRRRTGCDVKEILAESGETELREAERRALTDALAIPGRTVLGLPGGIVLDPADRELVADVDDVPGEKVAATVAEALERGASTPAAQW